MAKLAVLVSGTGSLLKAMLDQKLYPDLIIADRPCRAIDTVAPLEARRVPARLIERTDFSSSFDREAYTEKVLEALTDWDIDLIAMAGFMTLFSKKLFDVYGGRVLNTHPSLLPEHKGRHAVRDALASGARVTGCTIHRATVEMDEGEILAQYSVPIHEGDTEKTLHERIKEMERKWYPRIIRRELALLT